LIVVVSALCAEVEPQARLYIKLEHYPSFLNGLSGIDFEPDGHFVVAAIAPGTVGDGDQRLAIGPLAFDHGDAAQQIGLKNRLQRRGGRQPNWNNLGAPLIASNAAISGSDAMTNGQRFYRILLLP
jgi:hypothetical protein